MCCKKNLEKSEDRLEEYTKKLRATAAGRNRLVDYFTKMPKDFFWLTLGMVPVVAAVLRRNAKKARVKELKTEKEVIDVKKAKLFTRDLLLKHIKVGNS